jgi:hypothetical protein
MSSNGPSAAVTEETSSTPKTATAPSTWARARRVLRRWSIPTVVVVTVIVVLWLLLLVAVRMITTDLWFNSVHDGRVYTTMLEAQIQLFCIFGAIGGLVGGLTVWAVRRIRSPLAFSQDDDGFRWVFRKYEPRLWRFILVLAVVIPAILLGRQAASGWQTYLLWQHATPWHTADPQFHKDISYYIEVYPFHRMVVALLSQVVTYALWIAVFSGYWYGGWRLRRGRQKITKSMTRLVSVLLAAYLVAKAANFWLSRYALTTSQRGPVTGPSYTDIQAALPSKYVLMSVAIVCAIALVVNAFLSSRARVLGAALVLMVVSWLVVGLTWPALLFHFSEAPSAAKVDLGEISNNQTATKSAFGLDGNVTTVPYNPAKTARGTALTQLANSTAQTPVIDPNQLSPTFNVEQQLQAYYGFKSTLDIGRYDLGGRSQDVALAVRELQSGGIPKQSWVNNHLVYTHGYGVVAAPTTKVDPKTESPVFLDGGMPPSQQIPVNRPQVYFGQAFSGSSYSVVGQPAGSKDQLEFDHPGNDGSSTSAHTTYQGHGGIPIGSTLRRFLFAVQLHDPNLFFSSELNSASQLLMIRSPRARVAKVAPWLTLDGDTYPAVVNGQIKWIIDGYTTSSNYPNSQLINLHSASSTTLTAHGASVAQPNTQVNYLRNSVKAVVDAYTGKVSLYEWNQNQQPDPLLKAWEGVYPGLVQPQSSISSALLSQLRYPTDLFNVQRYLLAKYHVSEASNFYSGNDFWSVPTDPTVAATQSINAKSARGASISSQPSQYISMTPDGFGSPHFALSSTMVTLNGRQLAGFVYVNSDPGPDYGKITVVQYPSGAGGESPLQVQNDIESDTRITEALTLQRGGNSKVVLGDLEAIPVGGRLLYVEPVYTQSNGGSSFPILRHVIALYANGDPSFDTSLASAVRDAIRSAPGTG